MASTRIGLGREWAGVSVKATDFTILCGITDLLSTILQMEFMRPLKVPLTPPNLLKSRLFLLSLPRFLSPQSLGEMG